MSGLLIALRAELFVGLRSFPAKLVVLAPSLVVILQYLLSWLSETGAAARDSLLGSGDFEASIANNGWGYFVDGANTGLTIVGLLLVALAAYSFSYDRDTGALRHLVIRRASRGSVVVAKLLYLHLLGMVSILLLLAVAYAVAGQLWDFGAVVEDGFELISEAEIRYEVHTGLRLALLPLPAAIAFGVLVSVCAQSAVQAVTSALGITLALDVFKAMLGDFAYYIYATFQPSLIDQSYLGDVSRIVRGYSDVLIEEQVLTLNSWVPWPALLLFITISILVAGRKKL